MDAALLAVGDVGGAGIAALHLDAIGADIDAAGIGIAGDDAASRADIAPAVVLVMDRHREFQHVDFIVAHDVLGDRAAIDHRWRDALEALFDLLAEMVEHFLAVVRQGRLHAEHQRQSIRRAEHAVEALIALGIVGDVVEQQHRRLLDLLAIEHFGDRAELAIPMRAWHMCQLALGFNGFDELAQIVLRNRIV